MMKRSIRILKIGLRNYKNKKSEEVTNVYYSSGKEEFEKKLKMLRTIVLRQMLLVL
jgi:hypothetical protein